jgi:hypothetical protein
MNLYHNLRVYDDLIVLKMTYLQSVLLVVFLSFSFSSSLSLSVSENDGSK